ncbi:MAG TPA: hypothetical protein VLG11_00600 [Candidatus Saccharimonadales bacterium]|nr:hypothetical protein [Candidatus Saccharimonadales bacterium]
MNLVAFTQPAMFFHKNSGRLTYPYERVVGLWFNDGVSAEYIGAPVYGKAAERSLAMPRKIAQRLMGVFHKIEAGESMNCHRFTREMAAMPSALESPPIEGELVRVNELEEGAIGVVGTAWHGIVHSIGYGLGTEGLQVLSDAGELGFAPHQLVLEFHRLLFGYGDVGLYQLPATAPPE